MHAYLLLLLLIYGTTTIHSISSNSENHNIKNLNLESSKGEHSKPKIRNSDIQNTPPTNYTQISYKSSTQQCKKQLRTQPHKHIPDIIKDQKTINLPNDPLNNSLYNTTNNATNNLSNKNHIKTPKHIQQHSQQQPKPYSRQFKNQQYNQKYSQKYTLTNSQKHNNKHSTINRKIQQKLKKHIQKILNLTPKEITLLQQLYHELYLLKYKKEDKYKSISIETKQYLQQEQILRNKLIRNLNLPRFSIYYPNDHKHDIIATSNMQFTTNLARSITSNTTSLNLQNTPPKHRITIQNHKNNNNLSPQHHHYHHHKQKQRKLLAQYEKFVNRADKNVRIEAQKYRTFEYEIYYKQRKLFTKLPQNLRILLYQHCNIKKLPIHVKQEVIQQIITINKNNIIK